LLQIAACGIMAADFFEEYHAAMGKTFHVLIALAAAQVPYL
jgi:hypothetical protein